MTLIKKRPLVLFFVSLLIVIAIIAVIKRDTIANLILSGGDISLTGEEARNSPHAIMAFDFMTAYRAMDMQALAKLVTPEQLARLQQEQAQPSDEFQSMRTMMLEDLPADSSAFLEKIKYVQVHENRAVVTLDTQANSWFILLNEDNGTWLVSDF